MTPELAFKFFLVMFFFAFAFGLAGIWLDGRCE